MIALQKYTTKVIVLRDTQKADTYLCFHILKMQCLYVTGIAVDEQVLGWVNLLLMK